MRAQLIFKTLLLVTVVFCINVANVVAAETIARQGTTQVDNLKVGFITKGLDLTTTDAEKFWPVYNKYEDLLRKNHDKKQKKDISADEKMQLEEEQLNIKKEKLKALKSVLPSGKISQLFKLEDEFKKMLIGKLKSNN